MKKIVLNDKNYELIKDYKNGFEKDEVLNKLTNYFDSFDYILGDWAYGKLRLKGFCEKTNKNYKKINDISLIENYIKENCAYECRHFILKKI